MAKQHAVCPWWIGYLLASPLRRLLQNPEELLAPHIRSGMAVLEPGPGMGFFTLPIARMVGEGGCVYALDVQRKMLNGLERRAQKSGLSARIRPRLVKADSLDAAVEFSEHWLSGPRHPYEIAAYNQALGGARQCRAQRLARQAGHRRRLSQCCTASSSVARTTRR